MLNVRCDSYILLMLMLPFVLLIIYVLHQVFLMENFFVLSSSSSFYFIFLVILVVAVVIAKVFYSVEAILINGSGSVTLVSFHWSCTVPCSLNDERKPIKDQKPEINLVLLSFVF